ncbi:MAG TPA: thioredoxin domain-containing protein [Blastocatellia bacterium]|nr:thioredoxin domain-containing protein [Blastocatellia bacterium]HMY72682.1 thioredoxin domain-containing protein [Blastocatellia bacterium]HMZ20303.1 thioredoxin domain-containing protein [Blastocatellia bacterium]HNG28790.1 thioredoxin domain-containing protein [Blastocatellia bacterium]
MKRYLPFVIIAFVLAAAFGAGAYLFRSSQPEAPKSAASPTPTPANPQIATAPKGVVTLEEFGDYQCPPCGIIHPDVKKLKNEYGDRLRLIFYQFPLTQIHKNALDASHAAMAARLQNKFWEMHDLLYENQKLWQDLPDLRPMAAGFAQQLGLDVDRFKRDMDGPQVNAAVAADMRRGSSLGVTGTPTLFIDGQQIETEKTTLDGLRKIINQKLSGR